MPEKRGAADVPTPPETDPAAPLDRPVHNARDLTGGGTQAWIRLDDKLYSLVITRAGKLILTK